MVFVRIENAAEPDCPDKPDHPGALENSDRSIFSISDAYHKT